MLRLLSYYGSKSRAAKKYPIPLYDTIIEPFAGGAGYSSLYYEKQIILIEKNLKVYKAIDFLIKSSASDILSLPLLSPGANVNDFNICKEAKYLIGFWANNAVSAPRNQLSTWATKQYPNIPINFWGIKCRKRLAETAEKIKHWKIIHGEYVEAPNIKATWFIDPPYQGPQGKQYPEDFSNHSNLGSWCKSRQGQIIVCENKGATWLPFKPLFENTGAVMDNGIHRKRIEVIYHRE